MYFLSSISSEVPVNLLRSLSSVNRAVVSEGKAVEIKTSRHEEFAIVTLHGSPLGLVDPRCIFIFAFSLCLA